MLAFSLTGPLLCGSLFCEFSSEPLIGSVRHGDFLPDFHTDLSLFCEFPSEFLIGSVRHGDFLPDFHTDFSLFCELSSETLIGSVRYTQLS